MKIYRTIEDLEKAPEQVRNHMSSIIQVDLKNLAEANAALGLPHEVEYENLFDWLLGGFVYELETIEDLDQIETSEPSEDGKRWLSLREYPGYFDAVDVISGYTVIWYANTNSGGPTFFIPDWMKLHCSYIQKSIEKNSEDYYSADF
jgi:hypothetical protein